MSKKAEELAVEITGLSPKSYDVGSKIRAEAQTRLDRVTTLIDDFARKERERAAERLHAVMKAKVTLDYPGQSAQPIIEEMFERQFSVYRAAVLADEEDE